MLRALARIYRSLRINGAKICARAVAYVWQALPQRLRAALPDEDCSGPAWPCSVLRKLQLQLAWDLRGSCQYREDLRRQGLRCRLQSACACCATWFYESCVARSLCETLGHLRHMMRIWVVRCLWWCQIWNAALGQPVFPEARGKIARAFAMHFRAWSAGDICHCKLYKECLQKQRFPNFGRLARSHYFDRKRQASVEQPVQNESQALVRYCRREVWSGVPL